MKAIWKVILIGFLTTVCRLIGQLVIPAGSQTVLPPSQFALNGTLPLAFTVYGLIAYSLIAALFLAIRNGISGPRAVQGVKYGVSCCVVWTAYLLEPLAHVAPLDKLTYPAADSAALLLMGLLCGGLLGEDHPKARSACAARTYLPSAAAITVCFVAGRLMQYCAFAIYSSYAEHTVETLLWSVMAGAAISAVMCWLSRLVVQRGRLKRAAILGLLLFGVNLLLFNFFMPLVFAADIGDLLLRTGADILSITAGCLALPEPGAPAASARSRPAA